jgi:regulatory protein
LRRLGFDADTVQQVVESLCEQRLVNDRDFATFWRDNREAFKPRSRRALELELRQKGIDADTVAETVADVDDQASAYHAAVKKARSLAGLDYPSFRRRLGPFLRRRGFAYGLINHTIDQVWRERVDGQPDL